MKFIIRNKVTKAILSEPILWEKAAQIRDLLNQNSKNNDRYEIVSLDELNKERNSAPD